MNYKYVATCLFGLEGLLGAEIDALGFHRTETIDGRVYFEGDETAAAKANIWLRTAERVFLVLGSFPGLSENREKSCFGKARRGLSYRLDERNRHEISDRVFHS